MMRRLAPALALLATIAAYGQAIAQGRWGESYLPNLPVTTHRGETVRFYDDLLDGKIVVLSFIYTSCRDICPMVTARLAQLEDRLSDVMGKDVFFVSVSVDPEVDTPAKLKEYADAFQAGSGWSFITGKSEDIGAIRHKLGDRGAKISNHRNEVLIFNSATGDWERSSVFGDINTLATAVRAMDPVWRAEHGKDQTQQRLAGSRAAPLHTNLPGQAMFAKTCGACHTVGRGHRVGPDLVNLMTRRSRDWVARYIADPESLRKGQDATALALAQRYPTVPMPRLGLAEGDVEDIMAYIEAQTFNVTASKPPSRPPALRPKWLIKVSAGYLTYPAITDPASRYHPHGCKQRKLTATYPPRPRSEPMRAWAVDHRAPIKRSGQLRYSAAAELRAKAAMVRVEKISRRGMRGRFLSAARHSIQF